MNFTLEQRFGIQQKLNRLGYKLDEDGVLGEQTVSAIKDFQHRNSLKVDGVVGDSTNAVLDAVISKKDDSSE